MFPKIILHVAPPSPVAVYTQPDEYQGGNKRYLTVIGWRQGAGVNYLRQLTHRDRPQQL